MNQHRLGFLIDNDSVIDQAVAVAHSQTGADTGGLFQNGCICRGSRRLLLLTCITPAVGLLRRLLVSFSGLALGALRRACRSILGQPLHADSIATAKRWSKRDGSPRFLCARFRLLAVLLRVFRKVATRVRQPVAHGAHEAILSDLGRADRRRQPSPLAAAMLFALHPLVRGRVVRQKPAIISLGAGTVDRGRLSWTRDWCRLRSGIRSRDGAGRRRPWRRTRHGWTRLVTPRL